MRIIARAMLRGFWENYPDSEEALKAWFHEVKNASWSSPAELKSHYGSASIVGNGRVVFNICGNKYRLVVFVHYGMGHVYTRFIGTHEEYDKISNIEDI